MFLFLGTVFYRLIIPLLVHFFTQCCSFSLLTARRNKPIECTAVHICTCPIMQHKHLLIRVWSVYFRRNHYAGQNLLSLWSTIVVNSDQPCLPLASAVMTVPLAVQSVQNLQQGTGGHSQHWWGSTIAIRWRSFFCCFWWRNTQYGHRVILRTSLGEEEEERIKKRAGLSRYFNLKTAFLKISLRIASVSAHLWLGNLTSCGKTSNHKILQLLVLSLIMPSGREKE